MEIQDMNVEWPARCSDCGRLHEGTHSDSVFTKDVESGHQVYRLCYCKNCFDERGLFDQLKEQFVEDATEYKGYLGAFAP